MVNYILMLLLGAPVAEADSISSYHTLPRIEVTAPLKQRGELFDQPMAGSSFSLSRIENGNMVNQKDLSLTTPNLYMPDYGSKMTGTIYVRGIGARMEQPAMGLYVDNVPVLNKNNYEFDFYDISRIDVLRGPQSTLYGRNSIGGVINIFTLSPLDYEGVRVSAGFSTGTTADLSGSVYRRVTDNFGWSLSASHHSSEGFFTNEYDGSHADRLLTEGVRTRMQWKISDRWFVDNTTSFNYVRQRGFAYSLYDTETGMAGSVNHNDPCTYDRTSLINGTTVRFSNERFQFSGVTSYQFLDDKMVLDQDFLPTSMFTLTQAQHEHAVTQEVVFRSNDVRARWQWLTGAFAFYKHNSMDAPVTFKRDGIERLILDNANKGISMIFPGEEIQIYQQSFVISSRFKLPTYGFAAFHQSSYDVGRFRLTAGVRYDYENVGMDYMNESGFYYRFTLKGKNYDVFRTQMEGREKLSFSQVLPKFSALYDMPFGNLYASVTRGYKAGGVNTQIFSDILQNRMMNELIRAMGFDPDIDADYDTAKATKYDPENSWNYEVGSHLNFLGNRLAVEIAAFYIDCRNQQLTVFPAGQSTGRLMSNAGHSRSFGAEAAAAYVDRRFRFDLSYGYTNARFLSYDDGRNDYKGNYVPYVPQHTVYAAAEYRVDVRRGFIDRVTFRADWRGAGKMYWNEDNSLDQSFYGLLGGSVSVKTGSLYIDLWAKNLTGTDFNTFYFKSVGNSFVQRGKPRQVGLSLRMNL